MIVTNHVDECWVTLGNEPHRFTGDFRCFRGKGEGCQGLRVHPIAHVIVVLARGIEKERLSCQVRVGRVQPWVTRQGEGETPGRISAQSQ